MVVNYFATWCGPCMEELPDLRKLAKEYEPKGVVFVAVAIDIDNESKPGVTRDVILKEFAKSSQFPFPILLPSTGFGPYARSPPNPLKPSSSTATAAERGASSGSSSGP